MFNRRVQEPLGVRIQNLVWPRLGLRRWAQYIWYRIHRIQDTPHKIAIGLAVGVFVTFTPYMGLHFILAAICAWMFGGSIIASAIGTFIGNPFTFPFIWLMTYNLGNTLIGVDTTEEFTYELTFSTIFHHPGYFFDHLLLPMTLGGLIIGAIVGMMFYWPVLRFVQSYQERRRARLLKRKNGNSEAI